MGSIDGLPADQRAVLELVLRRGRSYDEIARLLSIDRAGVRQRALAAFDALGPQTRVGADRRALITDYLLDALPGEVAQEVREHLLSSASERAWARAIASELQGLSDHPLPEIPSNGGRPRSKEGRRKPAPSPEAVADMPEPATTRRSTAEVPPQAALSNGSPRELPARRAGSRVGGAVLLAVAAAVAIVLVLVFVVFTGSSRKHHAASAHRSTSTSTTNASSSPKVLAQINLTPPGGGRSPLGAADLLLIQNKLGIVLAARGLAPNTKHPPNYYAVWLYNSQSSSELVGFAGAVGSNHRLETAGAFPANYKHYQHLLVTLETSPTPKQPGRIELEGTL
jgi:hypothetical protein